MTGKTAFLYHEDDLGCNFGPEHPLKPRRYKDTLSCFKLAVFDDIVKHHKPDHASEEELMLAHSQEYITRA